MDNKLDRFRMTSVLNSCSEVISKVFIGEIDGEEAILVASKLPMRDDILPPTKSAIIHQNDIFTSGVFDSQETVKYSIIHPVSDALIKKYTKAEHVIVRETPSIYREKVLPIALEKGPNNLWIDNIFEQSQNCPIPCTTKNQEKVLYLDSEFLICPDLKWDRATMESLYLLVLIRDPKIYTIRELTAEHIPLLERIQESIEQVLKTYNYTSNQVKVYFHYYPTFYRVHIHVSAITASVLSRSIGTSILLHDVIENLKIRSDYYAERTMEIELSKGSYIYSAYQ